MPWIKVRIRAPGGQEVETSAVANSGFMWRVRQPDGSEYSIPVINIPAPLARRLGLVMPIEEGAALSFRGADASHIRAVLLGEVDVRLVIHDREMPWVRAKAVCMLGSDRVLLSEGLLERLRILPFGTRWLILGEAELREEAAPQYWREPRAGRTVRESSGALRESSVKLENVEN